MSVQWNCNLGYFVSDRISKIEKGVQRASITLLMEFEILYVYINHIKPVTHLV